MTVKPLTGPFLQATNYTRGRSADVDLLVLHTAEGARTVESLGNWFSGSVRASSNGGVDDDGYATYVTYNNTPWTNPPVNSRSDTLEICGFAAWSRAEWLQHRGLLEKTSQWLAWRAAVRGIPLRRLTWEQTRAGVRGVVDHWTVNLAYGKSNHTDIGPHFPWDIVMARAQEIAGERVQKAAQPVTKMAGKDRWLGVYNPPCSGQDVRGVQNALRLAGYEEQVDLDGVYTAEDATAISQFQQVEGITGERGVGPKTWAALRRIVANPRADRWMGLTHPHMTGLDVRGVRNALRVAGNHDLPLTNVYDEACAALIDVFKANRPWIKNERGCGPQTLAALRKVVRP